VLLRGGVATATFSIKPSWRRWIPIIESYYYFVATGSFLCLIQTLVELSVP
jgi:hypothetical protein